MKKEEILQQLLYTGYTKDEFDPQSLNRFIKDMVSRYSKDTLLWITDQCDEPHVAEGPFGRYSFLMHTKRSNTPVDTFFELRAKGCGHRTISSNAK